MLKSADNALTQFLLLNGPRGAISHFCMSRALQSFRRTRPKMLSSPSSTLVDAPISFPSPTKAPWHINDQTLSMHRDAASGTHVVTREHHECPLGAMKHHERCQGSQHHTAQDIALLTISSSKSRTWHDFNTGCFPSLPPSRTWPLHCSHGCTGVLLSGLPDPSLGVLVRGRLYYAQVSADFPWES